jgi:crotonobetainyl-CoA:carnitine CoA-transferase CaiB-like acyl-CoA transferase
MAPHDTYRCAGRDRWVAVAVRDEKDWEAFCHALGDPEWTRDPRFRDLISRWQNQDEMRPFIEAWAGQRSDREAAETLLSAGVPAAPVLDGRDVLFDPHFRERGYFEPIWHPDVGTRLFPRQMPAHYSSIPRVPRTHTPTLGEHNHEVLSGLLGLDADVLRQLEENGTIGSAPARASRRVPQGQPFEAWRLAGGEIDDEYVEKLSAEYGRHIGPEPAAAKETSGAGVGSNE